MEQTLNYLGNLFATNFTELGLGVSYVKGYESPLGNTYLYNLNFISQYNKKWLQSLLEKIGIFHHINLKLIDTREAHFGVMQTTNSTTLSLTNLIAKHNFRDIVVGVDTNGHDLTLDFNKIPHLLIAGTTGAGKSVLIKNLLVNLYGFYGKNTFKKSQFVIIDVKRDFEKYNNLYNTTFISDTFEATYKLRELCDEMDYRYQHRDTTFNDLYIVIDELADLMLKSRYEVEEYILRIAQLGRACNLHLIIATQYPKTDVLTGLIKANLPFRFCLKTATMRESIVCLDKSGGEVLNIGEAIFKDIGGVYRTIKVAYPEQPLEAKMLEINRIRG